MISYQLSQITLDEKEFTNNVLLIKTNHPINYSTQSRINETIPPVTVIFYYLLCLKNKLGAEYSKTQTLKRKKNLYMQQTQ